ncbi:hypothetical protein N9R25_02390 [Gammaproteobacteria bacterium]|nr:hypothetical protein [bacterium]MDA9340840.1 hypothetical protein [Gammaproteobacteria bacterium]
MKIDWNDIRAYLITGLIIAVVFGVSYLPIASFIINGDLSWARDFWGGFGNFVDVIREYNFYVFIFTAPIALVGWLLELYLKENFLSKVISTLIYPIFGISVLILIFTGYQDPSTFNLRV